MSLAHLLVLTDAFPRLPVNLLVPTDKTVDTKVPADGRARRRFRRSPPQRVEDITPAYVDECTNDGLREICRYLGLGVPKSAARAELIGIIDGALPA
jgi:hypothetical protein